MPNRFASVLMAGVLVSASVAVLVGPAPSMAQSTGPTAPPGADVARKSEPTPLSGFDVIAPAKPDPTPLSGVDVVVKRATPLSGVEVKVPPTCLPPRTPVDEEAPAPELVSSYPKNGQTVQPGYVVLRLTFDLPMACRGSLPQDLLRVCFSDGTEIWHESLDRKSLLIFCNLQPNTRYELGINHRIPEHFRGLSGREPNNRQISFNTSDRAPAAIADGLDKRDPQLAAILMATASIAGKPVPGSEPQTAVPGHTTVSTLKVQATNRCLQPRNPPDPDVPAPKVVSTFPAQGQTVRPGLLDVRFTFDLPMACAGGVAVKPDAADPCGHLHVVPVKGKGFDSWRTESWLQTWDRHTMRFRCRVEPGKRYVLFVNTVFSNTDLPDDDPRAKFKGLSGEDGPWPNFMGLGGKAAEPYELTFTVSNDAPVQTQEDADVEDPLMAALIEGHETDREQ